MPIPNPAAERERLFKAGREWFVQMMLACLVLEERPTKMNMAHSPSERGIKLLGRLDEIAFGAARAGVPEFYWEYRLPRVRALTPAMPGQIWRRFGLGEVSSSS